MGLIQTLRRRFGRGDVDAAALPEAEAAAYDRDSIRLSQQFATRGAAGPLTPTPDMLHPEKHES